MNLQLHVLTRIIAAAAVCLLAVGFYSLRQSNKTAEQGAQQIAELLDRQLELQLQLKQAGIGRSAPFPDFEIWKQSGARPGICVAFTSALGSGGRSLCTGIKPGAATWPRAFEHLYRRLFDAGAAAVRSIDCNGRNYGSLSVSPSVDMEIADAWDTARNLLQLSGMTVASVCLLAYLSIRRALRPAQTIVAGIHALEEGRLDTRLPAFELNEWRRIGAAINQLAAGRQQMLAERQTLIVKLMQLQEEERRTLARELHDEFGQCLAAINAVVLSIKQTAYAECPVVLDDAERLGRITEHLLVGVRGMLGRLRPAEFDALGLASSLDALVVDWAAHGRGKTKYRLRIDGDCAALPEAQAITLFRVAQECLTNVAKHAAATRVELTLRVGAGGANLTVADDGVATSLPRAGAHGIGLLGIRERAAAHGGRFDLALAEPHGLIVEVSLPFLGAEAERRTNEFP